MKYLIVILIALIIASCNSQESIIVSKTKVDWKDYPFLFEDSLETKIVDEYNLLRDVDLYEIIYLSDGLKIQSYAAMPKKEGKYPVVIYNRGGNRNYGALQLFEDQFKYSVADNFSKMAIEGYVVIGCNYRGCGKSEGNDEFGGSDVNDVLNLINVVQEIPEADASKIGMFGWSRGGMMTYLALTKTDKIKAAITKGAPADKTVMDRPDMETKVYEKLIPNYWENKEAELEKRSAIKWVDKFPKNVPLLMLHGDNDWNVKVSNSQKLAVELDKYNIPYRLKVFEGGDHGLNQFRDEVDKEVTSWFNKYLKQNEPISKMER